MRSRFAWAMFTVLLLSITGYTHPPTGIVVDKSGNVYFTDLETVWKLDKKNELQVFRAGVSGRHVHELTIDKDGNLYGADISYQNEKWVSAVWKISPAGQLTYLIEPTTNPPRGAGIWIDGSGNMLSVQQDNRTKRETLILRRQPDGTVTTLAGSAYGQLDGQGTVARFSSIGGMAFGSDGSLYLTDGTRLRRVTMDGTVSTLARDLDSRTRADRPTLFGSTDGLLTGLSVDRSGTVYLADAGNQRLLRVNSAGVAEVVYRGETPYYPNGVFVTDTGDLYVLEVGVQLPSTWLTPRVRKIAADGRNSIVAVAGLEGTQDLNRLNEHLTATASFRIISRTLLTVVALVLILGIAMIVWQRSRRRNLKQV